MSGSNMKTTSRTNWERVEALTDEQIDTSDLPPLDAEFFRRAHWRLPSGELRVVVPVDSETLAWYQSQGDRSQVEMAAALRTYAHRQAALPATREKPADGSAAPRREA